MNNVELSSDYMDSYPNEGIDENINTNLAEILQKLYLNNPNWIFMLGNRYGKSINMASVIYKNTGEILGAIIYARVGSDLKFTIKNKRIKEKRARGDSIVTKDLSKALLTIKKNFYPTTLNERFTPLMDHINNTAKSLHRNKVYDSRAEMDKAFGHGIEWMKTNFMEYTKFVQEKNKSVYDKIMYNLNECHEREIRAKELESIANCPDEQKVFVIRENGKYLTKQGDKCNTYTDDDLPEDLKMGIGLIKLCPDNHLVTNVGFRLNDKGFMVIRSKNDNDENGN